jgi:hypothetical protein
MLQVAHFTFDIDGRSNSGTARVASELIKELSSNPLLRYPSGGLDGKVSSM